MQVKPTAIKYQDADEHFLRRLGGAVIVHWDSLPADLQNTLVKQAAVMVDKTPIVQAEFQIEEFVKAHKGGDI